MAAMPGSGESVLDAQVGAMNGSRAELRGGDERFDISDYIDETPRFLAGLVLGAALTIFLLRLAGFRFSFGASIGGGS